LESEGLTGLVLEDLLVIVAAEVGFLPDDGDASLKQTNF
jgi:hypothetical protein